MTLADYDRLYLALGKRTPQPALWDHYSRRFVTPGPTEWVFYRDVALSDVVARFVLQGNRWVEVKVPTQPEPDEG